MRRLGLLLSILIAATACRHPSGGATSTPTTSKTAKPFEGPLPDIEVESLDGHAANIRGITKGKVVVIDLWATWCRACREVSARAVELAKSETNPDFMVIGLDQGEEAGTVTNFLGPAPQAYPIFVDHQLDMSEELGLEAIPAIIVVDRSGKVRGVSKKLDAATVRLIGELLAEKDQMPAPAGSSSTAAAPAP